MKFFVKVQEFIPARTVERLIGVPDGATDPRPVPQNIVVLRASRSGRIFTIPIGRKVLKVGAKYKLVTEGEKVFLRNR